MLVVRFGKNSFHYMYLLMSPKYCWMSISVGPDQMPHSVASDLGLHCLFRYVCLNTKGYYSTVCLYLEIQFKSNLNNLPSQGDTINLI